jgi:hypothetical protein
VRESPDRRISALLVPLGSVGIAGKVVQTECLSGHEAKIQAKYIARWAQPFLGLGDILVSIPVGDTAYQIRIWANVAQLSPALKMQTTPASVKYQPRPGPAGGSAAIARRSSLKGSFTSLHSSLKIIVAR